MNFINFVNYINPTLATVKKWLRNPIIITTCKQMLLKISVIHENEINDKAYTVSYFSYAPLFQGPIFRQKCWNRTFFLIIYLLYFFLSDDIEKKSESLMRIVQLREKHILTNMHMQAERFYIFLFAFCARHYPR